MTTIKKAAYMDHGSNRKFPTFLSSLFISFILIIIICTLIMSTLSCRILSSYITERTILSNKKLLTQYKSNMDSNVLDTINGISLKIVHDLNTLGYLNFFFNNPLKNNLSRVYDISRYLYNMSTSDPLIYSLSIFYMEMLMPAQKVVEKV